MTSPDSSESEPKGAHTPHETPSTWAVPPAAPEPVAAPDPVAMPATPDIPPPPQTPQTPQAPQTPQTPQPPPLPPMAGAPAGGYGTAGPGTYAPPSGPPPGGDPNSMMNRMGGTNNILGWLALLFGIVGTGCCCCWFLDGAPFLGGIPALILGFLHLRRVKEHKASMSWLGWLGIVLGAIALLGALCNFTTHWNDNLHDQFADEY